MKISKRLTKLLPKGQDRRFKKKVIQRWKKLYAEYTVKRFDKMSEGGGSWTPLKKTTVARKISMGQSPKILVATGLLRKDLKNIIKFSFNEQADTIEDLQPVISFCGGASYGNGLRTSDVANFHQMGGPKLPQRKILVQPRGEIRKLMVQAIADTLKGL